MLQNGQSESYMLQRMRIYGHKVEFSSPSCGSAVPSLAIVIIVQLQKLPNQNDCGVALWSQRP